MGWRQVLLVSLGIVPTLGWTPRVWAEEPSRRISNLIRQAEQGDATAQVTLGFMYHTGDGVAQDFGAALRWYREAADQGVGEALYNLALLHEFGDGTEHDYAKARRLYSQAFDRGVIEAYYRLGQLYMAGKGVTKNPDHAAFLWRRAAERGDIQSQHEIGRIYAEGRFRSKDLVRAHQWFCVAAKRATGKAREKAAEKCEEVAAQMTPSQIAEAEQRGQDWLRDHEGPHP